MRLKKSGIVSREFSIQPVFNQFGDCGAIDGDACPLESFRVVD